MIDYDHMIRTLLDCNWILYDSRSRIASLIEYIDSTKLPSDHRIRRELNRIEATVKQVTSMTAMLRKEAAHANRHGDGGLRDRGRHDAEEPEAEEPSQDTEEEVG